MVHLLVEDVIAGVGAPEISLRFHNTVVNVVGSVVEAVGREKGLRKVALSGGVFQNAYLFEQVTGRLSQRGYEVYVHDNVPSNDGCISFGQAYVLRRWLERGDDFRHGEGLRGPGR
jgi:hydrogenase maturation protein HypF